MDSKLAELAAMIAAWPGLVSDQDPGLVEDCLVLLPHLGGARTLIDIGSGGGLPGLPLKLARPDLQVTLLEANHRKTAFLTSTAGRLGLTGLEVVTARAEEAGKDPRFREGFEVATARALASMPTLVELCLPFLAVGGHLIAMKTDADAEVAAALPAIELLGGRLLEIVPAASKARARGQLVIVLKVGSTPSEYPRRPGVPARRPLGL